MLNCSVLLSEPSHLLDPPKHYHQASEERYPENKSSLFSSKYALIDLESKEMVSLLSDFVLH
jgi:hypothetical protein